MLWKFVVRRLLLGVVVMLAASVLVFTMSRLSGDPRTVFMDEYVTKEQWDAWGRQMGLDKPVVFQYGIWLSQAVRGDFGESIQARAPAIDVIIQRIPATLQLSAGAFIFAMSVAIPLGVLSAVKRSTVVDYVGRTFALFGQALPPFWLGIMLILIFSVQLGLLPTGRRGGWEHYVLPSVTLGWLAAAGMLRLVRSSMLDALDSEYVKLARAKGVGSQRVIWKHALRNAMIVPLTYGGLLLAAFITGTVVTETVFAWPGLGRLSVQAVFNNDFPVMAGVVLLLSGVYVFTVLVLDVLYAVIDPRIRY